MKKTFIFIGGFVAGIIITIFIAYIYTLSNKPHDNGIIGLTTFQHKGDCISTDGELEVFQVLNPNTALANTIKFGEFGIRDFSNEIVVLVISNDGSTFYDEQKIKVPKNKCARQIGTYQYTTEKDEFEKTVPAVIIE